ncbi:MAG: hypothetical protein GX591_17065 [Planctomycetes bacterium]|nr:hypothetical protein [Planctomycetota bacterium]
MAIRVRVKHEQQSVVPVRFVRAVTGAPVADAPDVDDRGFAMGTRADTWGESDALGAMVSLAVGDTVRVKVLREDIEAAARLYVTSTDTDLVRVVHPAGGGPLPDSGIFSIQGVADRQNEPVAVQVRYGSANGPVVGELEPHIFELVHIRLAVHLVTIDGAGTDRRSANVATTRTNVDTLVRGANAIWRPCGVRFTYADARIVEETIRRRVAPATGSEYLHRPSNTWRALPNPLGAAANFAAAGTVTTDAATYPDPNHQYDEFDTLLNINPIANAVNVYCVHAGTGWVGLSYVTNVGMAGRAGLGLAIADTASTFDLAHELGHYLGNNHADADNAGHDTDNKDVWLVRRLMYSQWPAGAPAYRNDVGYGPNQYGALISVKTLDGDYSNADGEVARSRLRARNPY